jgi:ABC-type glycerol-3-phosphate transport system substrate-binding protein
MDFPKAGERNIELMSARVFSRVLLASMLLLTALAPASAAAQTPTTVKVMVVDYIKDKTDKWLENEVAPAFQATHPNIKIEYVYVNWGTLDATIQGYFASGNGADILNLGSEYVGQYGDKLAPLNRYLGDAAWFDNRQYLPSALASATWNGELRGLPWLTAPRAYMCRTDLLTQAGINEVPTTFDGWLRESKAATSIQDGSLMQAGLVTTGRLDDWQEYLSLMWGLGTPTYRANGEPNFDTSQARTALQFMYDRRRGVYPDETVADLPQQQGPRLTDGTNVCQWSNLWGAPATNDAIWDNIQIAPGPVVAGDDSTKPVVQVFNDWLAIPAYTKNLEASVEFLKFLGSAENQYRYNKEFGSFPPRQDAWVGYVTSDPIMRKLADLTQQYGVGFSDLRESARLVKILQTEMPAYFTDAESLDSALSNIQGQYGQALRDAGRVR